MNCEEEQKENAQKARRNQRILTIVVRRKRVRPRILENAYYNQNLTSRNWRTIHSEEFSREESITDAVTRTVLIRKKKKWRGQSSPLRFGCVMICMIGRIRAKSGWNDKTKRGYRTKNIVTSTIQDAKVDVQSGMGCSPSQLYERCSFWRRGRRR